MIRLSRYHHIATFLAGMFLIFNVGLPVVVASCPMAEMKTAACGMCDDESSTTAQKLTSMKSTLCCNTVIAADRNSTEFVQAKYTVGEKTKLYSSPVSLARIFNYQQNPSVILEALSASPPLVIDIPIFTSSLLI